MAGTADTFTSAWRSRKVPIGWSRLARRTKPRPSPLIQRPASESLPAAAATEGRPPATPSSSAVELARHIAAYLGDKQAEDLVVLDVSRHLAIVDYFVVATVKNTRQAQAMARDLDLDIKHLRGRRKRNQGGLESEDSNWVLLDFDDVVVHLFLPEARTYYGLESLWADAPRLTLDAAPSGRSDTATAPRPTGKKLQLFPPPEGAK